MSKSDDTGSNGYELTKRWFEFAFNNQGKVSGNHGCMFLWFVEKNNLNKWVESFAAPRGETMAAVGISSFNTYRKVFTDLVKWGFIEIVKESTNQYTANIIAISKNDQALIQAQDKHSHATDTSTDTDTVAIYKTVNNKHKNNKTDDSLFDKFWELYDKKIGKDKVLKKWSSLQDLERTEIIKALPDYIKSTPDKKFRKDPLTYLNGSHWNDEIIIASTSGIQSPQDPYFFGQKPIGQSKHI